MKKDNKKALYENIMISVAREVKKVLNEGEEPTDKQARLNQLMREYNEIFNKIDDMEDDFFRKLRNSKEHLDIDIYDNHHKSIKPLEDELHNKFNEIIKLKKEIAASKQTISQSSSSKEHYYADDNNYEDDGGKHKFRVIRYTDKQLKNYDSEDYSGEDYVRCFVFDANEQFLPDFTPDWLYDILNNIDYMEFEESIFEMGEKSYNYLINHPDCVEHRYATNAEAYGDGDEYNEDEYGDDKDYNNYDDEDNDDYNSGEDYDDLILNNEFNVGDKVILTEKAKEFCKKLNFSWWNDKGFDKIYTISKISGTFGKKNYDLKELRGVTWGKNDLIPAV